MTRRVSFSIDVACRPRNGSFGIEQRFPFFGYNTLFNVSGNVTKLKARTP